LIAVFLYLLIAMLHSFAGVSADKTVYRGGTVVMRTGEEGTLALSDEKVAVFRVKKTPAVRIPTRP
jgi:hypothetical protein